MNIHMRQDMKVHAKIWVDKFTDLERGCVDQIENLCKLPFVYHHVAIMPDTHSGYGMPIGGVLATEGVVIPNAVGVDIGCGVISYDTNICLDAITPDMLRQIRSNIRTRIPLGKDHRKDDVNKSKMLLFGNIPMADVSFTHPVCYRQYDSAVRQLGTLGGGNHFIELQRTSQNTLAIMIHSGSRNLGKQVGDHYNKLAIELNERYRSEVPRHWELAFFSTKDELGKQYLREMDYCIKFAKVNRELMMSECIASVKDVFPKWDGIGKNYAVVDIAHNYAAMENHFGKDVMIHRKGATRVRAGEIGLIPGSQGTKSYRVEGLGNPDSFMSCSHGAGRKMSRSAAREKLNLDEEIKKMDALGIIHGIRSESDLDEAASAYKDIDEVMQNQVDLVKIVDTYTPLAVIKG